MDWNYINDINNITDINDSLEETNDIIGETKIIGFEWIEGGNDTVVDFIRDTIPESHLNDCPEIRYSPDSIIFELYPTAAGIFYSDENIIEIASEDAFENIFDMLGVVTHEIGHNAFEQLEEYDPQSAARWCEMYDESQQNSRLGFVTEYAKVNYHEDFAESYRTYINDPELLKFMSPAKYEFMKNLVFEGREYEVFEMDNTHGITMNKSIADAFRETMENNEESEDLIRVSEETSVVTDSFRCFNMIA